VIQPLIPRAVLDVVFSDVRKECLAHILFNKEDLDEIIKYRPLLLMGRGLRRTQRSDTAISVCGNYIGIANKAVSSSDRQLKVLRDGNGTPMAYVRNSDTSDT
jgi:hypothetical protein